MLHKDQIDLLYIVLGNRIKECREEAGFKQTQFAQLLQISRASLVNIEKGRQRAPLHILYEVARLLNLDINLLMPDLTQIVEARVNKTIQSKIAKNSAGDQDIHQKLMDFVRTHSISVKTSL